MRIHSPCLGKLLQDHLKLSWRGCVCLPLDTGLTPLPGFWGRRGAGKRPRSGSGVTRPLQMWDLNPGQAKLVASPGISPYPTIPTSLLLLGVPGAGTELPLPPAAASFAAHIKPNTFSKAFQFLMKTSAFTLSLASARRCFGHCCCLVSPGAGAGPVFPLALVGRGLLLGAVAGSRHIPIPGCTSRYQLCQLCQPTPQHGT